MEDGFSEGESRGTHGDRRCALREIACVFGTGLTRSEGWGCRCQAYFWECTDLITIGIAVCTEQRENQGDQMADGKTRMGVFRKEEG